MDDVERQSWDMAIGVAVDVLSEIEQSIKKRLGFLPSEERTKYRAVVLSYLVEDLAEKIRFEMDLPPLPKVENDG